MEDLDRGGMCWIQNVTSDCAGGNCHSPSQPAVSCWVFNRLMKKFRKLSLKICFPCSVISVWQYECLKRVR